jgi:hypothetical protein
MLMESQSAADLYHSTLALRYIVIGLFGAGGLLYYRRMRDLNDTSLKVPLADRLESWAQRIDCRPFLVLAFLAVLYVILVLPSVRSHLWFDELNTYYIAQAPGAARMIEEIRRLDLNPPLIYVLVRASMDVFGPSEFGARLPVMLGFFAASACVFWFVSRRAGVLWGAASVGLFWYSPYFMYATEARPYGLLLGFLGLTLVSWDSAVKGSRRGWSVAGVAVGATAMMLTHVYAMLWIMPFCAAEIVRYGRTRRPDWPVWAALLFPVIPVLTYLPLIKNISGGIFPPDYQGSAEKAYLFYLSIFVSVYLPLIIAGAFAFGTVVWRRDNSPKVSGFESYELVLFLAALLPPVLLNAVASWQHIAFYPRHAIATVLTTDLLLMLILAYESKVNRLAGLAAALVMMGFTLVPAVRGMMQHVPPSFGSQVKFDGIDPSLPLVANSALTFLEMDHYEDPALLRRLYYLVDRDSALQYAHSNLTEILAALKQYFPVRANVAPYSEFAAQHQHFLVWGIPGKGDWLLKKLKAEDARLVEIGVFDTPYPDSHLWDVTLAR